MLKVSVFKVDTDVSVFTDLMRSLGSKLIHVFNYSNNGIFDVEIYIDESDYLQVLDELPYFSNDMLVCDVMDDMSPEDNLYMLWRNKISKMYGTK